jgi:hypothetical protein
MRVEAMAAAVRMAGAHEEDLAAVIGAADDLPVKYRNLF